MKKLLLVAIMFCLSAKADEWLPMMDAPQSGDMVVLWDRTYVLFTWDDFNLLTNKMAMLVSLAHRQWNRQHQTESGRREWHGEKVSTVVTTNAAGKIEMVAQYADGYRHVSRSEVKRPSPPKPTAKAAPSTDMPLRLRKARRGVNANREVK